MILEHSIEKLLVWTDRTMTEVPRECVTTIKTAHSVTV